MQFSTLNFKYVYLFLYLLTFTAERLFNYTTAGDQSHF